MSKDIFREMSWEGLEKFGITQPVVSPTEEGTEAPVSEVLSIDNYLFFKSFDCPCCRQPFQNWYPKEKRIRRESMDLDLRPKYTPIDRSFYEAIICPLCGYSGMISVFSQLLPYQRDVIKAQVQNQFTAVTYEPEYTVQDAIERFKYALFISGVISPNKYGTRAYIAMKLSWFYREIDDLSTSKQFTAMSLEGFKRAMAEEDPPIMGMSYDTLTYVMARQAMHLDNRDMALPLLSRVIVSRSAGSQLKNMARILKEELVQRQVVDSQVSTATKPTTKSGTGKPPTQKATASVQPVVVKKKGYLLHPKLF